MKKTLFPNSIIPVAICLLMFSGKYSYGQQQDANLWTKIGIKYDLDKKNRISFEEEFRFHENITLLDQNHAEIGLDHELSKRWQAGIYYRFIYEKDPERSYSIGHRGWLQIEYLLIDSDLELSFRTRLQSTFTDIYSSRNGDIPEWYNRYKISAQYKPSKTVWVPNAGIEFWHFLNPDGTPLLNKYRASFGLEYRYSDKLRLETFYNYQSEIQVSNPNIDHIFGMSCTYYIN